METRFIVPIGGLLTGLFSPLPPPPLNAVKFFTPSNFNTIISNLQYIGRLISCYPGRSVPSAPALNAVKYFTPPNFNTIIYNPKYIDRLKSCHQERSVPFAPLA